MKTNFQIMAKPAGPDCNLNCDYCYYQSKKNLFGRAASLRMSPLVLREFTRQYLKAQPGREVIFAWQGGEPTLMGVEFFEEAVRCQQELKRPGQRVGNTIQTNGTLLDERWGRFLKENRFLVGLSLDGPAEVHDAFRKTPQGRGTFARVSRSLQLLREYQVEFNVLCTVSQANARRGAQVYRFFRNQGIEFIQFISLVLPPSAAPNDYQVTGLEWGRFLCDVFGQWVAADVGKVFVMNFENTLAAWFGLEQSACAHRRDCGQTMVLEHNGDLYSCDFFVDDAHRLGNIMATDLRDLADSSPQHCFAGQKQERLAEDCHCCPVRKLCQGGCPADRIDIPPAGQTPKNIFCDGYRLYYQHTAEFMRRMSSVAVPAMANQQIAQLGTYGNEGGANDANLRAPSGL